MQDIEVRFWMGTTMKNLHERRYREVFLSELGSRAFHIIPLITAARQTLAAVGSIVRARQLWKRIVLLVRGSSKDSCLDKFLPRFLSRQGTSDNAQLRRRSGMKISLVDDILAKPDLA